MRVTGVDRLGGRRQRSPKRLLGWAVGAVVLLTGGITVAFSPIAHGQVSLTNPEGKEVTGRFSPDRLSWTATEPLGYAKTYTWSGTATGIDHLPRAITGSFQTVVPDRLVGAQFNVADNATYGIAMPI